MSLIREVFSENSKLSLMRVLSSSIVFTSLFIIVYQALTCGNVDWTGCCSLCALGLSGKAGQKYLERKNEEQKPV